MPNTTPNFGLPYPNGTDEPCDFAQQWCDFTTALKAVLDGFQETIDRTVPASPMAQLRVTIQTVFPIPPFGGTMSFDTVTFDTAGLVDFDANPAEIFVDRAGVFVSQINTTAAPVGVNTSHSLQLGLGGTTSFSELIDRNTNDIGNRGTISHVITSPDGTVNAYGLNPGAASITIRNASLAVFWHADARRA